MEYEITKVEAPGRKEVEMLGATYAEGEPLGEDKGKWREKLGSRADMIGYLKTGERYWYSDDWYGSEKRKNPA